MRIIVWALLLSVSIPVWSDTFKSKVHSFDYARKAGEPHLIKFQNGRVAFVEDLKTLRAIKESAYRDEALKVQVDQKNDLKAAQTIDEEPAIEEETDFSSTELSYSPTVLNSSSEASSIFRKMRRGWQRDSQCYNRAHVWSYEEFYRSGLKSMKLFMFFTNRYIRNYRYQWWFHVAPLVYYKSGSNTSAQVLDPRFFSGPRGVRSWTDSFVYSRRACPVVTRYSDYSRNQQTEDCYLMPVSMYFWQPRDIEKYERTGFEKVNYIRKEVEWAYWEAF